MKNKNVSARRIEWNGTCRNCLTDYLPRYYNYCPKCGSRIAEGNFARYIPEKTKCAGFWRKINTEDGDRLICSVCYYTRYDYEYYDAYCENCGAEMFSFREGEQRYDTVFSGAEESGEDDWSRVWSLLESEPES